jgi:hypothetical protein
MARKLICDRCSRDMDELGLGSYSRDPIGSKIQLTPERYTIEISVCEDGYQKDICGDCLIDLLKGLKP